MRLSGLSTGPRANQEVASLIPGLGTCLGCRVDPWLGTDVSLGSFSLSLPLSLKINKVFKYKKSLLKKGG